MLIDFKCENYYCISEEISFSMRADEAIKHFDIKRIDNTHDLQLNKTSAFYGKNGTGKTTLLIAFYEFSRIVINSSKESQQGEVIDVHPYAFSDKYKDAPTFFEIVFINGESLFRYGIRITKKEVIEEYLYSKQKMESGKYSNRESQLFERKNNEINLGRRYKSISKFLNAGSIELRRNTLLLSYAAQMGHSISKDIVDWFTKMKFAMGADGFGIRYTARILEEKNHKFYDDVIDFLESADLGFEAIFSELDEIDIAEDKAIPEYVKELFKQQEGSSKIESHNMRTEHCYMDENGDMKKCSLRLEDESDGIRKMVSLAGPIIDCLKKGNILFIDEIESHLHYTLTKKIIYMFNSDKNENGAQLIFSTNSPLLMDINILNRDQMWILNTRGCGSTELNRLSQKKFFVRKDTNITQKIIEGAYGSAPKLK